MSLIEKVKIVLYRVAEKGLEVFLVNTEADEIQSHLVEVSEQYLNELPLRFSGTNQFIELEPIELEGEDTKIRAIAIEGYWYETPSLRANLKDDYIFLKKRLSQTIPDFDSGVFVSMRDLVGKAMKSELKLLRELKEVISDRNSVRDI